MSRESGFLVQWPVNQEYEDQVLLCSWSPSLCRHYLFLGLPKSAQFVKEYVAFSKKFHPTPRQGAEGPTANHSHLKASKFCINRYVTLTLRHNGKQRSYAWWLIVAPAFMQNPHTYRNKLAIDKTTFKTAEGTVKRGNNLMIAIKVLQHSTWPQNSRFLLASPSKP